MKRFFDNDQVLLLLRLVIGGVFLYAGATKIRDHQAFADSIASFKILPMILINPLAFTLPPLEILSGGMLMGAVCDKQSAASGVQPNGNRSLFTAHRLLALRRLGAFSVMILCSIFCLAVLSALLRGIQVDCGCFGGGKPSVLKTWLALGRDLLFLAIAAIIYSRNGNAIEDVSINSGIEQPSSPSQSVMYQK